MIASLIGYRVGYIPIGECEAKAYLLTLASYNTRYILYLPRSNNINNINFPVTLII